MNAANRFEWDVRRVPETGSTNADLSQLAQKGAPSGTVLVADYQTHGRGRHSRKWESPPGETLLFSILLRPACRVEDFGWLTQLAGLSICDVCQDFTGVEAWLKWPNDVLAREKKLAGILAEAIFGKGTDHALVLGVGFNINWPKSAETAIASASQFRFPATSLLDLLASQAEAETQGAPLAATRSPATQSPAPQPPATRSPATRSPATQSPATQPLDTMAVLDAFLGNFKLRLDQIEQPGWHQSLRAEVKCRSATIGQKVMVELKEKSILGKAVDISLTGALVLEPQDGPAGRRVEIMAGDVIHAKKV